MVGQTISQHGVVDTLRACGRSQVYLAADARLHRKSAVRFLLPQLAARPERMERSEREAETLATLDHPNIFTTYESVSEGNAPSRHAGAGQITQRLAYPHQAVDKDPGKALAYAGLALGSNLIRFIASHSHENAPRGRIPRTEAAYCQALALDENIPR